LKHKALKTAKVLQIPFLKEVAEVLGEIQSPVGFEEVNKLIIDLFLHNWRTNRLIHLKM
jgi:hypothetical protein